METEAEREIRARILDRGRITFAEFMGVALYYPRGGYYSDGAALSSQRDFYTSPAAHPAFGALVAVQLSRMWELLGRPRPFHAVEIGAGSGILARDVTDYAPEIPGRFSQALRYAAVDRAAQGGLPGRYGRVRSDAMPFEGVVGCVLSNELFDSFPVHRFEVRGGRVLEVHVELRDGELRETLSEPSTPLLEERARGMGVREGGRGEVNLQAGAWMEDAARALRRGFALTIDYGYYAAAPRSGDRAGGTVGTFYRHTGGGSPYRRIGGQDMTAHVDFTALVSAGERVGLRPVLLSTQAGWLDAMGMGGLIANVRRRPLRQAVRDANLMAMRELVKPDGLGGFKVLVQEKDTGVTEPEQLLPASSELAAPLLRREHARLMEGRYPHATFDAGGPYCL